MYQCWPRKTGMNEEIALRLLMQQEYDVKRTLSLLESPSMSDSYVVVRLVNQMTQNDPKIELIGYLLKLQELAL